MPIFLAYLLESSFWWLVFMVCYYWMGNGPIHFTFKRWYLRLVPLFAYLIPLASLDVGRYAHLEGLISKSAIDPINWFQFNIPSVTVTLGSILLIIYFIGFMVALLSMTDRFWEIGLFLKSNGNRPLSAFGWQRNPTTCFSRLIFSWPILDETKRKQWAGSWLPIHPVFAWEAFSIEGILAIHWWHPVVRAWGSQWRRLYLTQDSFAAKPAPKPSYLLKLSGLAGAAGLVALLLSFTNQQGGLVYRLSNNFANLANLVLFKYEKEQILPVQYSFAWGDLMIPLHKFASPNGYEASLDVQFSDFQQNFSKELKILRNGKPLETGIISIIYKAKNVGKFAYINDIDPKNVLLWDRRDGKVYNDSLGLGDELTIFGESGEIYISKVTIRISDPGAMYQPAVMVPEINRLAPSFCFQVIARPGQRALVKVDKSDPKAEHILNMYRDVSRYEIVNIPGFRTNRRYLTEADALFKKGTFTEVELAPAGLNVDYLPEYQDYQDNQVVLRWGDMEAGPSSYNYPLDSFQVSAKKEIQLRVGDRQLPIISFECIIASKTVAPYGFKSDRLDHPALLFALDGIAPETSIYFDRIIVKSEEGQLKLFPAAFVFNVAD
ncbi:MAG: hypothetical protein R2830_07750 [Saprospiraceae bacterium]